jgi:HD superfamily phosphohydrolase
MAKDFHEVRDPIHVFVKYDSYERDVIDSRPFQRLRHINQLALSHLVYPGATHKRFEHSLGVMELAGRVFDVITQPRAIRPAIRELLPEVDNEHQRVYWRSALRMAALCHDMGHLPFSHTSEDLFPPDWDHERMTVAIIRSEEMGPLWDRMKLKTDDVAKLAVGPEEADRLGLGAFSRWEDLLSEIIVGDAFGVDRMDYLLRDSYHSGVSYGRFDHYRLIDTLRILPSPEAEPMAADAEEGEMLGAKSHHPAADVAGEPMLGVEKGGLHSAESLLLARYFMFQQVYLHPVRRIYDIHLRDFLKHHLPGGAFSTETEKHLAQTDVEITCALRTASWDKEAPGHIQARCIVQRQHFKVLYERNPNDIKRNADAVNAIARAAIIAYGDDNVRGDPYTKGGGVPDFPVLEKDGRIVSSLAESQTLKNVPVAAAGFVFVSRDRLDEAKAWLEKNRDDILAQPEKEEGEE